MVEAKKSEEQRQISSSVCFPFISMGTVSFWLYHAMLSELFHETSSVSPTLQLRVNWRAFTSSHSTRSKPQCPSITAAILHRWCHLQPESTHPLLQSPARLSCQRNIFIAVDSAQTNTGEIRTTQKGNRYWISFRAMSSLFLPYLHRRFISSIFIYTPCFQNF